ncbi:hypothetical protein MPSEU_000737700 [Mayamaea pseudoterrestris]|nr:hypothetical protein MPSEU_000737700 [Mayamaea pseudoterrestris]
MEILDTPEYGKVISWLPHGRSFVIYSKTALESKILPTHFHKQSKYSSFTRKLNRWGFSRIVRGPEMGAYFHPYFRRGEHRLAVQMSCHNSSKDDCVKDVDASSPPRVAMFPSTSTLETMRSNAMTLATTGTTQPIAHELLPFIRRELAQRTLIENLAASTRAQPPSLFDQTSFASMSLLQQLREIERLRNQLRLQSIANQLSLQRNALDPRLMTGSHQHLDALLQHY